MICGRFGNWVWFWLLSRRRLWLVDFSDVFRERGEFLYPQRRFLLWGEGRQAPFLVAHFQPPIQMLAHFYLFVGIALVSGTRWQLQALSIKGQRIIIGHRASMLEAEEVVRLVLLRPGEVGCPLFSRLHPEPAIEFRQVVPQHFIGLFQVVRSGFAQLFHQTILQGSPQPFYSPFRLRALGGDQLNP